MTRTTSRLGLALTLALTTALATACSSTAPEAVETTAAPTAAATTAAPTPDATPTEEPVSSDAPTCETIIPASTVAEFEDLEWTAQEEPFVLAGDEITGGLQCKWGDLTAATDHIQMFGWAPIDEADAIAAQDQLVADGWSLEEGDEGIYVTESAETAIYTDDDGYGWTYLFGDGWVKFADTKQSLLLVEWPQA
ncbi:hypothetical protein ACFQRL_06170 [Microbacterium fluvii]|uniref:Nitrate ABC transporter substrate-binding protein n=1 Tax=Microbacterium fluvii TaxID=415215 RepID=A0ABW2HBT1_9MICO|nr:hypothetical protein [Microbacterium fluvii]MCU4672171.1 hypothetical protein [Microbacterium fluvii]